MIPKPFPDLHSAPRQSTAPGTFVSRPLGSLSMPEVLDLHANSEESAGQALIAYRWPYGVECTKPDCGSNDVRPCRSFKIPKKIPAQFYCRICRHRFTVRDNYFLSDSTKPLRVWLWALYLVEATSEFEPAIPATLSRQLGVSEACAAYMIWRIRQHVPGPAGPREPIEKTHCKTPKPHHVDSTDDSGEPSHQERNPQ